MVISTSSFRLDSTETRPGDSTNSASDHSSLQGADPQEDLERSAQPIAIAQGVYITVHGHFYQPPRDNPYLDAIECQPSAAPYHDWNERIYWESYRPNAFARVLNDREEVVEIVNNFEYFSFNIGPTLMGWLEEHGQEVYARILEADRKSLARLGHGNAIAQVYNHIIMPLANERDKRTQIRWGKADFRRHFGREPEGMWLAETAVDLPTVSALIDEGIRYIILAPSQAERCRPLPRADHPDPEWQKVSSGDIDPTRPYRCWVGHRFLDIFFYDGPISAAIGFEDLLASSFNFAERLGSAVRHDGRPAQLISVATDGETFGHHKMGTEKCLAYAFTREFPQRGWQVTNYGDYLHRCPPTWEVVLKPVTAWSCSHGVNRWQDDCGCARSDQHHQKWRKPLRQALDWLRDQLIPVYEAELGQMLHAPWQARDEYIEVVANRDPAAVTAFLKRHQRHPLLLQEQVRSLQLLEMARHTLLMYTSCGWFFEEISRPEGVQILRYASRALDLAERVTGLALEAKFLERLAQAPSNDSQYRTGAEVYQQLIQPTQFSLGQIAIHYIFETLVQPRAEVPVLFFGYRIQVLDEQRYSFGPLTLTIGKLQLTSGANWDSERLAFVLFHGGGWEFHGRLLWGNRCEAPKAYEALKQGLGQALLEGGVAHFVTALDHYCGTDDAFGLSDLRAEERHLLMAKLTEGTLIQLDQLYAQVYRENYGILMTFRQEGLALPPALRVAAQVTLNHRAQSIAQHLETSLLRAEDSWPAAGMSLLKSLEAIATEAQALDCTLMLEDVTQTLEHLIETLMDRILGSLTPQQRTREIQVLIRLVLVGCRTLNLPIFLERVQERFWVAQQQLTATQTADVRALAQVLQIHLAD